MSIAEKLQTIAENEQRVYEAGKAHGETVGKKAHYDEFWDGFMENGNRTSFTYAFAYWSDNIFYPKYNLNPVSATGMFANCKIKNFKQRLIDCGVVLNTSKVANFTQFFGYSQDLTHVPTIDARSATTMYLSFANDRQLVEIEKIILSNSDTTTFVETFNNCTSLVEIRFEGIIGNSIQFHGCPKLSKASITSVINALSTTTSGLTVHFSKTAVETAFGSTTSEEWLTLRGTKSNWTISLV